MSKYEYDIDGEDTATGDDKKTLNETLQEAHNEHGELKEVDTHQPEPKPVTIKDGSYEL